VNPLPQRAQPATSGVPSVRVALPARDAAPAQATTPKAFRRYVLPLLGRYKLHLLVAMTLCGIHGGAMALQNLYPKWFFAEVIDAQGIDTAERWRRVAWLGVGYPRSPQ
jgi:hypothetical protein